MPRLPPSRFESDPRRRSWPRTGRRCSGAGARARRAAALVSPMPPRRAGRGRVARGRVGACGQRDLADRVRTCGARPRRGEDRRPVDRRRTARSARATRQHGQLRLLARRHSGCRGAHGRPGAGRVWGRPDLRQDRAPRWVEWRVDRSAPRQAAPQTRAKTRAQTRAKTRSRNTRHLEAPQARSDAIYTRAGTASGHSRARGPPRGRAARPRWPGFDLQQPHGAPRAWQHGTIFHKPTPRRQAASQ